MCILTKRVGIPRVSEDLDEEPNKDGTSDRSHQADGIWHHHLEYSSASLAQERFKSV